MQIFVLGMHRSGTSALARILNLMGAHFGDGGVGIGANDENPKGFWERRDVRLLNDAILFNAGCDWDCVSGFDAHGVPEGMAASHREAAAEIVLELDAHRPWFVKEPRLCLVFPLWRPVLEMPFAIHIHRNPLEVARSMERRNGLPLKVGLALWEAYNVQALKGTRGVPRTFVSYEELMRDPLPAIASIQGLVSELGGYRLRVPGKRELDAFLQDGLRHQREGDAALLEFAGESQVKLYERLRAGGVPEAVEVAADSLAVLREYEEASVDVAKRITDANARADENVALKIERAVKRTQLDHALQGEQDARERLRETERKLGEALATSQRLDKELTVARRDVRQLGQRVRDADERQARTARANAELAGRRSELERQREALREAYARRSGERDLVVQDRSAVRTDMRRLQADMRRLADNHAELRETRESLAREHATLQRAHAGLERKAATVSKERDRALREGAALKSERDLLRSDQAELSDFAEALTAGFETTLTTRRWRLGHALLSLPRRLLFRPPSPMVTDALRSLVGEHRTRRDEFAQRRATLKERRDADLAKGEEAAPGNEVAPGAVAEEPAPRPKVTRAAPVAADPAPFRRGPARTVHDMLGLARNESVDVIVCVHNALEDVRLCLHSVATRTTGNYRLVVVNDGSDEETSAFLQEFCAARPEAVLIETHGPLGYTRAANEGLRASEAEYAVLLNSDTVVPSLWLERMLACMHSDDSIGVVGPLSNAASWQSVPDVVGDDGGWAVNELPPGYDVDVFAELVASMSRADFPRVDFVNGFCFMVRRAVVDVIGLLDEERFPRGYGEENDYCLRAADAGFSLAIADQCYVFHGKSKSFGKATRDELAKRGSAALTAKHGKERIDAAAERLAATPALWEMRERIAQAVAGEGFSGMPPVAGESLGVLFVMPVRGGAGGAHSVVQETMGMRRLGVDARVAVDEKYRPGFEAHYAEQLAEEEFFVFYRTQPDLLHAAASFDVIVATLWSSPALIRPLALVRPEKLYMYYIQDYEPWFFPEGSAERLQALDSYTLIPSMQPMAKTQWLCETVGERHHVAVHRVAPSLDHSVYFPAATAGDEVVLTAMIRPNTVRRGPLRTLRVFRAVSEVLAERYPERKFRIVFFGCDDDAIVKYVAGTDPEFSLDFPHENRGVLTREGVADLLREAHVFADLSDYQAFGRTGLEAMACGCAVVLPESGGVSEYAVDGENALVVDTTSGEAMRDALVRLTVDEELRSGLAERGIETAGRYSIERASLSELVVMRGLLAKRQREAAMALRAALDGLE